MLTFPGRYSHVITDRKLLSGKTRLREPAYTGLIYADCLRESLPQPELPTCLRNIKEVPPEKTQNDLPAGPIDTFFWQTKRPKRFWKQTTWR